MRDNVLHRRAREMPDIRLNIDFVGGVAADEGLLVALAPRRDQHVAIFEYALPAPTSINAGSCTISWTLAVSA